MIRFLATFLVAALMMGSVALCQWYVARGVEFRLTRDVHEHNIDDEVEDHVYHMIMTPTFDAGRDPFALTAADGSEPARILVRAGTNIVVEHRLDVKRGQPIQAEQLAFSGDSVRLYIEATPSDEESRRACALRVSLFRDGVPCDDVTLWTEGSGESLREEVVMSLTPRRQKLDRGLGERTLSE